ncbi:MAG: prepilin-type N-terminal cleavage/methylation domain-containing protein [Phycisphaerales bacterium]|nr:prepilin-type N-terminal cleavage/methylation domain-containing protein [Phycisphaerales bacterium]
MKHSRLRRGFSLIEVIVAITIVAIMAAVVVPRLIKYVGQAKEKRAKAEVAQLAQLVRLYMTDSGVSTVPADFDLMLLAEGDDAYLDNKDGLLDPWGNSYEIRIPGEVNIDFDIICLGADGITGGEGEGTDVISGQR